MLFAGKIRITYMQVIAIILLHILSAPSLSFAGGEISSTLAVESLFNDSFNASSAQALMMCGLIEKRAIRDGVHNELYIQDILLWEKTYQDFFPGSRFERSEKELRIYLPAQELLIRYYDPSQPSSKGISDHVSPLNTHIISSRLSRQILRLDEKVNTVRSNAIAAYNRLVAYLRHHVGYTVSEDMLGGDFGITDLDDMKYPDGVNVAIYDLGTGGMGMAGVIAENRGIEGVNFLYLLGPGDMYYGSEGKHVFVQYAAFVNKDGKIGFGQFATPLQVDAIFSPDYIGIKDDAKVALSGDSEIQGFCSEKYIFRKFLREKGLSNIRFAHVKADSSRDKGESVEDEIRFFWDEISPADCVIKPVKGSGGRGVGIFSNGEEEKALEHAQGLLREYGHVLLEERIESFDLRKSDEGERQDWNVRVLATWAEDRPLVVPEAIYVRYDVYGQGPVNLSAGSEGVPLSGFLDMHSYTEKEKNDTIGKIQNYVTGIMKGMEEELARRQAVIGFDLIMDGTGEWEAIEANAVRPGCTTGLEKEAPEEEKGLVVAPFALYATRLAEEVRAKFGAVQTDTLGDSIVAASSSHYLVEQGYLFAGEEGLVEQSYRNAREESGLWWENFGAVLLRNEKFREAEESYRKALSVYSQEGGYAEGYGPAYITLSAVLSAMGRVEEAEDVLDRGLSARDARKYRSMHECVTLYALGEEEEAERVFYRALDGFKMKYFDDMDFLNLGILLERIGKDELACKVYQKVLDHDDQHVGAWYRLARCFYEQEKFEKAMDCLKNALTWNPDHKKARELLNRAIVATDEKDFGRTLLDQVPLWRTFLAQDGILAVRIPVEVMATMEDEMRTYLNMAQKRGKVIVRLYHMSKKEPVGSHLYRMNGIEKKCFPEDFSFQKDNTITLLPFFNREIVKEKRDRRDIEYVIRTRMGGIDFGQTQLVPIGLDNDSLGLIRGIALGLRLIYIARHFENLDKIEESFVEDTLFLHLQLSGQGETKGLELVGEDIIDLAIGDFNRVARALNKMISTLPLMPFDTESLRRKYEIVEKVLISA